MSGFSFFAHSPCQLAQPLLTRSLARLLLLAVIAVNGCQPKTEPEPKDTEQRSLPRPLRVAVVDDPEMASVIQRQWKARTEGDVTLVELDSADLPEATRLGADVIVYPSAWLGTLAERKLIDPLPEDVLNNDQLDLRGTFDLQRVHEVVWGKETYAVTFGSPQLVLMYRADLFQKQGVEPPATWQDYQKLLTQLTRDALGDHSPPDDQPWSAVAEPWAPAWASRVLLARAAVYARHPSQYSALFELRTGKPLIGGEPFQKALQEMSEVAGFNVDNPFELTPESAKAALLAGQTAMAWCWPVRAEAQQPAASLPADASFAFAELPGGQTVYNYAEKIWDMRKDQESQRVPLLAAAGRLGSVTSEARYSKDAASMLCWLSGRQWGEQIASASRATTLYRSIHVSQPERWVEPFLSKEVAGEYAALVAKTQMRGVCLSMPRIPGWTEYVAALDEGIRKGIKGQPAAEVLEQTAQRWQQITDQMGTDKQQAAFYRDLGLEP